MFNNTDIFQIFTISLFSSDSFRKSSFLISIEFKIYSYINTTLDKSAIPFNRLQNHHFEIHLKCNKKIHFKEK